MQPKKNPLISIQKEKPLFTLVGFICSFTVIFISFSFTVFQQQDEEPAICIADDSSLIILPITIEEEPITKEKPLTTTLEPNPFEPEPESEKPSEDDTEITKTPTGDDATNTIDIGEIKPKEEEIPNDDLIDVEDLEIKPEFPGGMDALHAFISENLKYPKIAEMYNEQGTVFVLFVIEKDGRVTNVRIRGMKLGYDLDEEAMRVIKLFPKFTPGSVRKKPVRTQCVIPIEFILNED